MLVGFVVDTAAHKPIPYANVIVLGTRIGTQTDDHGMFRFDMPDTGVFRILVRQLGCEPQIQGVTVRTGRVDTMMFRARRDTRLCVVHEDEVDVIDTTTTGRH